jgi:hypothetical protein
LMSVYPQFVTDFEVERIMAGRMDYLRWVQRHFAGKVLPPHPHDPEDRQEQPGDG